MSERLQIELNNQTEIAAKAYRRLMLANQVLEQTSKRAIAERQKASAAHGEAFETLTTSLTRIGELVDDIYQSVPGPRPAPEHSVNSSSEFRRNCKST